MVDPGPPLEYAFGWKQPPLKKRRRKTPKKDLEAGVVRECLQWLHECSEVWYFERRNTGAVAFEGGGFMRFGAVGAADIWCLLSVPVREFFSIGPEPGQYTPVKHIKDDDTIGEMRVVGYNLVHVEVEAKRRDGKGKLSPAQDKFKQRILDIGVPYLVVTSAEDLAKQLQELGLTNFTT